MRGGGEALKALALFSIESDPIRRRKVIQEGRGGGRTVQLSIATKGKSNERAIHLPLLRPEE